MSDFAVMKKENKTTNSGSRENCTGICTQLKERREQSTGLSFDVVRVHYDSALPAKLDTPAYMQKNQVEIDPGQKRHLPHKLEHVVQQKPGTVRANAMHSSGVALNTDIRLEHQTDEIGAGKGVNIVQKMGDNVIQRFDPTDTTIMEERQPQIAADKKEQKEIIDKIENNRDPQNNKLKFGPNQISGNYGEMKMDDYYESRGYIRISDHRVTDLTKATPQGIDGVYYRPSPNPKYIIAEAKFGRSKVKKSASGVKQMGALWIRERLNGAVGESAAQKILDSSKTKGEVECQLFKISQEGKVSTKTLLKDDIDQEAENEKKRISRK